MAQRGLFARKSLEEAVAETEQGGFRRALGAIDLTSIGIAAIIGAGIFFLLGREAHRTGPLVMVSLVIGGVAAVLSAFTYAEFASLIPGSGSAYLYAYAALGEFPAFVLGWIILNAYAVGNVTVAIGWGGYLVPGLEAAGIHVPESLALDPFNGGLVNLPAAALMLAVTLLTLPRIRESTFVNNILVGVKVLIVLFVVVFGAFLVRASNYADTGTGHATSLLAKPVFTSAAILFFAYLGYDTVAATAEEAKNPRRHLPIAILLSVGVSMLLYILMAAVVTGITPSSLMPENRPPVAAGFADEGYPWAYALVTVGALVGLATVVFAFQVALARILHAMGRDGLLPRAFGRLHSRTGTPWAATLWTGLPSVLGAGLLPLDRVADMAVLASIVMYLFVAVGVLVLKWKRPEAERRFDAHWSVSVGAILVLTFIAVIGIGLLMHLYFFAWIGLGLMVYGFYAHRSARRLRMGL